MDPLQRQWQTRARGYTPSVFDALDERLYRGDALEPHATALLLFVEAASKVRYPSLVDFAVAAFYAYARQTERDFAKLSAGVVPRLLSASAAIERVASEAAHIMRVEERPAVGAVTQALTLIDVPGQSGIVVETRDGYVGCFAEI